MSCLCLERSERNDKNYELNYCDTIDYDSVNELIEKERADTKLMMKMLC